MRNDYIYQTIHTLSRHALHVEAHCRILERSFINLYTRPLILDAKRIERDIERRLTIAGSATEVSVFVELRAFFNGSIEIVIGETSIYDGYELRSLNPVGVCVDVVSPFGLHCTSARRSTLAFADGVAEGHGGGVAVECEDVELTSGGVAGRVISIGGGAVFGVANGGVIASTALCDAGSVERNLVVTAAKECGYKVEERNILRRELVHYDELFYCDHYGITALSRVDSRVYSSIIAERIARALTQPWRW